MTILNYLKDKIKSINVVSPEAHGLCPFHDDTKMSFSMNIQTGLWKCFTGCGEGNFVQFVMRYEKIEEAEAKKKVRKLKIDLNGGSATGAPRALPEGTGATPAPAATVPEALVEKYCKQLQSSPDILKILHEKRGFTDETIKKFRLGYDGDRLWIPVEDAEGRHVNIRKYDVRHHYKGEYKTISYKKGYGKTRLFPYRNLKESILCLFEGETDCILGCQNGYAGFTVTGGAGTFPREFVPLFKEKTVYVCYDHDKAGSDGARRVFGMLSRIAKVCKIVSLPVEGKGEDFTDYIVKYKHTKEDFDKLLVLEPEKEKSAPLLVSLEESTLAKNLNKEVIMNAMVSGKDLAPYMVPRKIRITCSMGQKRCLYCPLHDFGGNYLMEIKTNDQDLLAMIACTKDQQTGFIKRKAKIINCPSCEVVAESVWNIEEVQLIPEIDFSSDGKYVSRRVFSLGEAIQTNKSYQLTGIVLPHPKTQVATHIIYHKKLVQDSLEQVKLTAEDIKNLRIFCPASLDKIEEKVDSITRDMTYNVTHMYKREDLITAMDLVYHSPVKFKFLGKEITRGWAECLIIGDTRTGKSETLKTLLMHYRAGEIITGENTSYAGLVGGMQQSHDKWIISWGKIPLNDRRLVGIDEVSGLALEQLASMSGIRSSGVAEIVKIQTERTHARTRMIWLSNTRHGRQLNSYNYGVTAIKELIGKLEDIARFDFAVSCATDEVDTKEIHMHEHPKVPHIYTPELCHKLILWAWSREMRHIHYTIGSEKAILEHSQIMGKKYSSSIPLVEPAEQRIKLARLSAALAIRLFATKDGENVQVEKQHVEYAVKFLQKCYDKSSMGYDMYSLTQADAVIPDGKYDTLKKEFINMASWEDLKMLMLEYQIFRKQDLMDQIGYLKDEATILFKWMGKNRLVKSTPNGYVKSPAFTAFLKRLNDDKSIEGIKEREEKF